MDMSIHEILAALSIACWKEEAPAWLKKDAEL